VRWGTIFSKLLEGEWTADDTIYIVSASGENTPRERWGTCHVENEMKEEIQEFWIIGTPMEYHDGNSVVGGVLRGDREGGR
jgi:hypothetical protein